MLGRWFRHRVETAAYGDEDVRARHPHNRKHDPPVREAALQSGLPRASYQAVFRDVLSGETASGCRSKRARVSGSAKWWLPDGAGIDAGRAGEC